MPTGTQLHDAIGSEIGARPAGELDSLTVSVWETILVFAVPVIGLIALIVLLVVAPRHSRRPRYRVGQPWPYPPLFWTANPRGAQLADLDGHATTGERGGARGSW